MDISVLQIFQTWIYYQFFDPLIYRVFVKILPAEYEEYIFQPCEISSDVRRYIYARYVVTLVMLCDLVLFILFPCCFPYNSLSVCISFSVLIQIYFLIIRVIHKKGKIYDSFLLIPLYSSWSFNLFGLFRSSYYKGENPCLKGFCGD